MADDKPEIVEGAEAVVKAARKAAKAAAEAAKKHAEEAQSLRGQDKADEAAREAYLAAAYGERARILRELRPEDVLAIRATEEDEVVAVTAGGNKFAVAGDSVEVLTGPGYVEG